MTMRYRWYRIQLPNDCDLIHLISKKPFTQNVNFGFSLLEVSALNSLFKFFWRTKVVITKLDDEGSPLYEEVTSVNFTNFAFIKVEGVMLLRVENPGRNIRDLLNALELLVGLGFTCKLLTFEKIQPTKIFENVEVTKLIGLKVVGAVIDEDLVARIEFASRQGMIKENLKVLNNLNYKVDTAIYELIFEGVRGQISIASNGLVKISGQLSPKLIHLIELDLPSVN